MCGYGFLPLSVVSSKLLIRNAVLNKIRRLRMNPGKQGKPGLQNALQILKLYSGFNFFMLYDRCWLQATCPLKLETSCQAERGWKLLEKPVPSIRMSHGLSYFARAWGLGKELKPDAFEFSDSVTAFPSFKGYTKDITRFIWDTKSGSDFHYYTRNTK